MVKRFLFATPVVVAALFASSASNLRAQGTCQAFRAATPLAWDNKLTAYTGMVYAMLGDEMLIGKAVPGAIPTATTCDGLSCQDAGGTMRFVFREPRLADQGDSLTIELHTAVYTLPGGFGIYHATEKVIGGTGRFLNATGLLFEKGPFVAWVDGRGELQSQYFGELGGSICGVRPAIYPPAVFSAKETTNLPVPIAPSYRQQLSPSRRK